MSFRPCKAEQRNFPLPRGEDAADAARKRTPPESPVTVFLTLRAVKAVLRRLAACASKPGIAICAAKA